ncbi:type VI secretion system tip protein VgrG [Polyangium jinanense]|uniref:type VI secretion system Vgr family protein n=1 Tax=Polyangium jinanense TaxID=2829994 RepID=UPI002340ABDF|nr:type VI secretion system tip protein TssI/VgrG [Polyangium jinanense]MDC3956947.1 type VI secretion system tip protein VgrG [Polyangium jinanense]
MSQLALWFASGEDSLSVRKFSVREVMSTLFEVSILALSPIEDLDIDSIIGQPAGFKALVGLDHVSPLRAWSGVCSHMTQLQAETTGLSTYELRIVPNLWRATLRRNHRVFQHETIPAIVRVILAEWGIEPELRISANRYPKYEYRVQYGETDYAFVCRLLEEAGISFHFIQTEDLAVPSRLVLSDAPQADEPRHPQALPCVDNPNESARREFVTKVSVSHEVRPGKYTIRDFDFRLRPDHRLFAHAGGHGTEDAYEQYHYIPGSFQVETAPGRTDTPAADDKGGVRSDMHEAQSLASRSLESERKARRVVSFETNAYDLAPGIVFSLSGHPRAALSPDRRLLLYSSTFSGAHDTEWRMECRAVFADVPHRPERRTPRPRIVGVQSAVVVGPPGEEIHTDEFGRVRVQFHWDREGEYDDGSSCWIRVSQGWAGNGFGMMAIPRVGQEVLVDFFEGDPDRPVIVGRVYNNTSRVPYKLPDNRTKSGWKTDSSPGSNGYNELSFEDSKGRELVSLQAERNLEKVVKVDEAISVGRDRKTTIGEHDEAVVGVRHRTQMMQAAGTPPDVAPTQFEMIDKRIRFTTGEASIVLDGPNITLQAKGVITIHSSNDDVVILGGPWVKLNCGPVEAENEATVTSRHVTGVVKDQDGEPMRGVKVVVKGSDGVIQQVETDAAGMYLALVQPGGCEVSLPGMPRYGLAGSKLDDMTTEALELDDCGPVGGGGSGKDIVVHARMQACCRGLLSKLGEQAKKLKLTRGKLAIPSLPCLGGLPMQALKVELLPKLTARLSRKRKPARADAIAIDICKRLCALHADAHRTKGEKEEGEVWADLAASFSP